MKDQDKSKEELISELEELRKPFRLDLRKLEERYRNIIEAIEDGYYELNLRGDNIFFNSSYCEILGYPREELSGLNYRAYVDEPTAKNSYETFNRVYRTDKGVKIYDYEIIRKDGTKRSLSVSVSLMKDDQGKPYGFRGIVRDVTDQKRVEEELRKSEERLALALDGAELSFWDFDLTTGKAIWGYRTLERLGYLPDEVEADLRTWKRWIHPQDWPHVSKSLNDHLGGDLPIYEAEHRTRTKSGDWIWISTHGKVVERDSDGRPLRMLGISLNITERKRAEQEKEGLQAQLVQAQKMEAIGTLTGGIAHEFNNLLTIVSGYAELLRMEKGESDPEYSDIERIINAARRGAELVRSLQTFSRNAEMNPVPMNLNDEVEQVKKLLDRTLPKMIEIELNLSDGLKTIEADAVQIRQVLLNLALNARDAMPEGGKLTIQTDNIGFDDKPFSTPPGTKPVDYVQLIVSDTGIGMDKETLDRIFDPFYSTKGLAYKTGLGLAVAHGIIEQHRGHISCESKPGQGTTFKIYFPVAGVRNPDEVSAKPEALGGKETILLVDDEEGVRDLASRMLDRAGYRVLTAGDGRSAVELYEKERKNISLVILDLIMPKMGGRQCVEKLRMIEPKVKVVFASGYSDTESKEELIQAGGGGFVGKPFQMARLLSTVRKALDAG